MQKKYSVRKSIPQDTLGALSGFSPRVQHFLFYRGIKTREDAEAFLSPDFLRHSHDPFLMKGMERVVERVLSAIQNGEKICVYSDYDSDGIPGAVVFHDFLKLVGYTNFFHYIPHRHTEGFGLHSDAIETISKDGATLLITIDCGITDVAEVAHAKSLGIEVIITDHHLPSDVLPDAYAILDPKQSGCEYPFKDLCGSGVIWKIVQALLLRGDFDVSPGKEKWLLDMVGIATCADMVPLLGENRTLAYFGLKVLRKSPRRGLQKLFAKMKLNQPHITEDDIGFTISPRINVASRMGIPMDAFRLLSTSDEVEAGTLADMLEEKNAERKGLVAAMVKEIRKRISERTADEHPVLVIGNPEWRPGLLGLAANTLLGEDPRPVFLWGREGGETIKGSCRSDGSVSVVELMRAAESGTFLELGGHTCAGGFSVSPEAIHFLEARLAKAFLECKKSAGAGDELFVDLEITTEEIDWSLYREIEVLAPFGMGNPKPLFLFRDANILEVKQFGKEKNHTELKFAAKNGKKIPAICFFKTPKDLGQHIVVGEKMSFVGAVEKSVFRNFPELRIRIVDVL